MFAIVAMVACEQEPQIEQEKIVTIEKVYPVGKIGYLKASVQVMESQAEAVANIWDKEILGHIGEAERQGYWQPFLTECHNGYNCTGWNGPYNNDYPAYDATYYANYFKCESWHPPMAYYGETGSLVYSTNELGGFHPGSINSWNCI